MKRALSAEEHINIMEAFDEVSALVERCIRLANALIF